MKYIDADRLIEYLEKEADKEFKATEENANSPVVCHFHNGCRMMALDTIDFIKQLQQEQPSEDLENAAEEYATTHLRNNEFPTADNAFIAGAEWQKEQMLKEAVEGEVYLYSSYKREATAIIVDIPKENLGDKVKIVIVPIKED